MYDEASLLSRLEKLNRASRTTFAAVCAERLWPILLRYGHTTGIAAVERQKLSDSLEDLWRAISGDEVTLQELSSDHAGEVPEEEWADQLAYGENLSAAVTYAVRAWVRDSAQDAAWAAYQCYEAADFAAQRITPPKGDNRDEDERVLFESDVVQTAVLAMERDLSTLEQMSLSPRQIRERAQAEGAKWCSSFP